MEDKIIMNFSDALKNRRTIYSIDKNVTISNERILDIINEAVKYTPSAFNSQSGRVIVLFGKNHDRLWDITKEVLRKMVPEDRFSSTEEKMNSFKNGYGTILFFEDDSIIKSLQEQFKTYKDNFPIWSQQSSGMLQFVVWTSLEVEGLGASLQHYNHIIDEEVKKEWNTPNNWKLIAQLPFGNPTSPADEKEFLPLEGRVKIYK